MSEKSKTVEVSVSGNEEKKKENSNTTQKTLVFNIHQCITELEDKKPTIENFPEEFLIFLRKATHIIDKRRNAFLDFLGEALPRIFTKKVLQPLTATVDKTVDEKKTLLLLAEKLQKAIDNTKPQRTEEQAITRLKEAFIGKITTKILTLENRQTFIDGIRERLEPLIIRYHQTMLQQNRADAPPNAAYDSLGVTKPASNPSSTSHSSPPERAPAPTVEAKIKTPPQKNTDLIIAINNLTKAICQHHPERAITDPETMQSIREGLEEICESELPPNVKIIASGGFYKHFETLFKATGKEKSPERILEILNAFQNLCIFIGINKKSTPTDAALAIRCLSEKGGEFEYSELSSRKYGKSGNNSGNMAWYLQNILPGELELTLPTPLMIVVESKAELETALNLGRTINALTGEICRKKEITDPTKMQRIRDILVAECAKYGVVEEITQENLFTRFQNLIREIHKTNCDEEGIERRKTAFQTFCTALCIPTNSSAEDAANKVHTLFDRGGEFEFSTLPALKMPMLDSPPQNLETLLRNELPKALIKKTKTEITEWEDGQRAVLANKSQPTPAKPKSAPLDNQGEKNKAPSEPASQNASSHNFDSFLALIEQANKFSSTASPSTTTLTKS